MYWALVGHTDIQRGRALDDVAGVEEALLRLEVLDGERVALNSDFDQLDIMQGEVADAVDGQTIVLLSEGNLLARRLDGSDVDVGDLSARELASLGGGDLGFGDRGDLDRQVSLDRVEVGPAQLDAVGIVQWVAAAQCAASSLHDQAELAVVEVLHLINLGDLDLRERLSHC